MRHWVAGLWFNFIFWLSTGWTQRRLSRVWSSLIEKDIHPANVLMLHCLDGRKLEFSAYGSQLCVVHEAPFYCFTMNYSEAGGLYVHTKADPQGDWQLVYRQASRWLMPQMLHRHRWVCTMKMLAANLQLITDRSAESMVGT